MNNHQLRSADNEAAPMVQRNAGKAGPGFMQQVRDAIREFAGRAESSRPMDQAIERHR